MSWSDMPSSEYWQHDRMERDIREMTNRIRSLQCQVANLAKGNQCQKAPRGDYNRYYRDSKGRIGDYYAKTSKNSGKTPVPGYRKSKRIFLSWKVKPRKEHSNPKWESFQRDVARKNHERESRVAETMARMNARVAESMANMRQSIERRRVTNAFYQETSVPKRRCCSSRPLTQVEQLRDQRDRTLAACHDPISRTLVNAVSCFTLGLARLLSMK